MLLKRKWPHGSIAPFGDAAGTERLRPPRSPAEAELGDVLTSLGVMLATRRGVGHLLPNFGFSDAASVNAAKLLARFAGELAENLRSFEPRVEILEITEGVSDEGELEVVLDAELKSHAFRFQIRLHPARRTLEVIEPSSLIRGH